MKKITYKEFIELDRKIEHPFSRIVFIGTINNSFGSGIAIKYDIGNGLAIFVRSFIPNQNLILTEESNIAGTSFIFNLGEELSFIYKDKKNFSLKKNNFLIGVLSNEFSADVFLEKDKQYNTLSIGLKEELFLKLNHPIKNINEFMKQVKENGYCIFQDGEIDTNQIEIINTFKEDNSFKDLSKNFFLESKANELVHYTIEKISKSLNSSNFLSYDEDRLTSLKRAKEIIMKEYSKNLSIKEIAYRSAINECYLKKDFKEYFGVTVYEMLQKQRLQIAKQLLENDGSVKEIALKVGYKHTGNFSKLFQNHFGISPSKYKKQFI